MQKITRFLPLLVASYFLSLTVHALSPVLEHKFLVFDREQTYLQLINQQGLVVDHVTSEHYEVYGPAGSGVWLSELGLRFIPLQDEGFHHHGTQPGFKSSIINQYPTPEEIEHKLIALTKRYASIMSLETIGHSSLGRPLLVVKISDNPTVDEVEPEFKYVANMHGNEIVGREMMVSFIEELGQRYQQRDPQVMALIDHTEIYIMPSLNPDGAAKRRRANHRSRDLNRDFPDFSTSDRHNESHLREPETQAMMHWQARHRFALSANFHGGAVCVNYPWDTSGETFPLHSMIVALSQEYANAIPEMKNSRQFPGGITNGYQWYEVNGGMQDWSFFWHDDLQITVEVSARKWPRYSHNERYYREHRPALLRYMERVHMGAGFFSPRLSTGKVKITLENPGQAPYPMGNFTFSGGEFYKVLPEGHYRFDVTNEDGAHRSFNSQVSFKTPIDRANITILK